MKRKIALILAILGLTAGALSFSGTGTNRNISECPLRGTPDCPEYPSCCK